MKKILFLVSFVIPVSLTAQPGTNKPVIPYFPFQLEGNWGFIDTSGKIVITPQFEVVMPFCEGLAAVKVEGEYGFINETGQFIIQPEYLEAASFKNGVAFVRNKNESMLINSENQVLFKSDAQYLYSADSLSPFSENGLWGVFNSMSGKVCVDPTFEWIDHYSEGLAPFLKNRKMGYINAEGKIVIAEKYEHALPFCDGLAAVKQNGLYGYINKKRKLIIKPAYAMASFFSDGVAPVSVTAASPDNKSGDENSLDAFMNDEGSNDKWGYINKKGKLVGRNEYSYCHPSKNGLCLIFQNSQNAVINTEGKMIIPFQVGEIVICEFSRIVVINNSGAHFYDSNGNHNFTIDDAKCVLASGWGCFLFSPNCNSQDGVMQIPQCLWGYINSKGVQFWKPSH